LKEVKNKKYDTVKTVPISNRKIIERGEIYNPNTQMYDCLLSWLGTGHFNNKWQG